MWRLIDNDGHNVLKFTSLATLKQYAKEHLVDVRKSPIDDRCYYSVSVGYVPSNS